MSYPEFREEIFRMLKSMVSEEITLQPVEVEKVNGCIRHGISFTKDKTNFAPTIYLEAFYQAFMNGTGLEKLAQDILRCYNEETIQIPECIQKMETFENAKPLLFAKLLHFEENENLLKSTPYITFLDFAIVVYFEVNDTNIFRGSVLIKKHHLEVWGITEAELLNWAIVNTKAVKGTWFRTMSELMEDFIPDEADELLKHTEDGMFVLTNMEKYMGAVTVTYPDVMEKIAEQLGEDFFLLPASVHEWVVVPDSYVRSRKDLFDMVRHCNDTVVSAEEILSYNVYLYSTISQKIHVLERPKLKNN